MAWSKRYGMRGTVIAVSDALCLRPCSAIARPSVLELQAELAHLRERIDPARGPRRRGNPSRPRGAGSGLRSDRARARLRAGLAGRAPHTAPSAGAVLRPDRPSRRAPVVPAWAAASAVSDSRGPGPPATGSPARTPAPRTSRARMDRSIPASAAVSEQVDPRRRDVKHPRLIVVGLAARMAADTSASGPDPLPVAPRVIGTAIAGLKDALVIGAIAQATGADHHGGPVHQAGATQKRATGVPDWRIGQGAAAPRATGRGGAVWVGDIRERLSRRPRPPSKRPAPRCTTRG